jgi:hypothetical protein
MYSGNCMENKAECYKLGTCYSSRNHLQVASCSYNSMFRQPLVCWIIKELRPSHLGAINANSMVQYVTIGSQWHCMTAFTEFKNINNA